MNYDSFCMAAAAAELRESCLGAFVDQVHQPAPLVVTLAFTGRGPRRSWLLSCDARWARAHATSERRANPGTPPGFCMLLRKHLRGSHLTAVEQVRFDRILRLSFRRGEEHSELVHEVMGRHSNLILLDAAGAILGAVKSVPPSQTRVRPVLTGLHYQDPPGARPDPRSLSLAEIREVLPDFAAPEEITRAFSGWGTFAAREVLTGGDTAERIHALMERIRAADFSPTVFEDDLGRPKGVWAFPSCQPGWERGHAAPSLSAACEEYYSFAERHADAEALRGTLLSALNRAHRTAALQLQEAQSALDGLDRAEKLRIAGELLNAQGSKVEPGADHALLQNWYDPEGGTLRIELDPELDARANAERCFHRYRRAMASAEAALERVPTLEERVRELEARLGETETAAEDRLRLLLDEAREEGLLRETGGTPRERAQASEFPSGVRIRRVPVKGWEVLYGENATSNDYLTTRCARPGDLWLHARAVSGCHVVIRSVPSLDRLPPEVLREAARLAARHSDAKHSSVVPVDYTFRRYVRKPRGSKPGLVTYSNERTVHVEP